jgi:hypothetical protein
MASFVKRRVNYTEANHIVPEDVCIQLLCSWKMHLYILLQALLLR